MCSGAEFAFGGNFFDFLAHIFRFLPIIDDFGDPWGDPWGAFLAFFGGSKKEQNSRGFLRGFFGTPRVGR